MRRWPKIKEDRPFAVPTSRFESGATATLLIHDKAAPALHLANASGLTASGRLEPWETEREGQMTGLYLLGRKEKGDAAEPPHSANNYHATFGAVTFVEPSQSSGQVSLSWKSNGWCSVDGFRPNLRSHTSLASCTAWTKLCGCACPCD